MADKMTPALEALAAAAADAKTLPPRAAIDRIAAALADFAAAGIDTIAPDVIDTIDPNSTPAETPTDVAGV